MFTIAPGAVATPWKTLRWMAILALRFGAIPSRVKADCECGYSSADNVTSYVFTDLLESDFLHLANISTNTDWKRQEWNTTKEQARGPYGESCQITQVVSNPLANRSSYAGSS
jgi:hypothetical protein